MSLRYKLVMDNDGKPLLQEEEDYTEDSSVSSDDSFGANFALSSLRLSVLVYVRKSLKRLARRSTAKLSPFLKKGSDIMLKPHQKKSRIILSAQQQARRRRRRDNMTKLNLMLKRINQDPFVASRVVLAVSASCLMIQAGGRFLAGCTSLLGFLILQQTTHQASTGALEAWYYVAALTVVISICSWFLLYLDRYSNSSDAGEPTIRDRMNDIYWLLSEAGPRLWGLVLAYLLYLDLAASKDGSDNAVDTIQTEVCILGVRPRTKDYTGFKMHQLSSSEISIYHGPTLVGKVPCSQLPKECGSEMGNRFVFTAFSHFLESAKGSMLDIHIVDKTGKKSFGIAKVGIPTIHGMKMSSWFSFGEGDVLVEIQSRPLIVQFLFRASTILTAIFCFVLAGVCWK